MKSLNKYLLTIYYMPDTEPGNRMQQWKKSIKKILVFIELTFYQGKQDNQDNK